MLLAGVTIVAGVALGYVRGGRLGRLSAVRLRWAVLLGVAVAAQAALMGAGIVQAALPGLLRQSLLVLSLLAVLAFVGVNRALPGMWLVLVGFALNAAVIVPNGAMPVSADAIAYLGGEDAIEPGKHRLLADDDVLPWLADVIPVPGLRIVVSAGDVLLALGVGFLVHRLMRGPAGRHAAPYGVSGAVGAGPAATSPPT